MLPPQSITTKVNIMYGTPEKSHLHSKVAPVKKFKYSKEFIDALTALSENRKKMNLHPNRK